MKFSPNGKVLATWGMDNAVRTWNTGSWERQFELMHAQGEQFTYCHDVCFSNDSRILVSASSDKTVRVWNTETGQPRAAPLPHPDWVFSAALSPNGQQILTACRDHMARLWEWRTGKLVCPALPHHDEVTGATFASAGRFLLTCSIDRTARIWEWKTGKPLTPPLPVAGVGYQIDVAANDDYALVAGHVDPISVIRLASYSEPTDQRKAESLLILGELLSGKHFTTAEVL